MTNKTPSVSNEVTLGFLPAKKSERHFGFWDMLLMQLGIGISTFCFLVGGYTGMALDAKDSIMVIMFGNAFGVFLIVPIALIFARYGIDTFVGFRSALGYLGNNIFFGLFMIIVVGFISVGCFMAGESIAKITGMLGGAEFLTTRNLGVPLFAILVFSIAAFFAYKGPTAIKWLNWIGVPAVVLILISLIVVIFFKHGVGNVFAIQPSEPYETGKRSFATALELNVGLGFSWLVFLGQYSRLAKTEKIAVVGTFWSFGILVNVAAILGALTALVVGSLEPSQWMLQLGGEFWGLIGLILLVLGNIAAVVFLIYTQAISFKTVFPKRNWGLAIGSTFPAVLLMMSPVFYDAYDGFLALISYLFGVIGAIIVTDFYFVKKQRLSVRDLYDQHGAYKYWRGINPSALISVLVGTCVYWALYNPLLDQASGAFSYITAGLPTYFVTAICYFVSSKYFFSFEVDHAVKENEKENLSVKESALATIKDK